MNVLFLNAGINDLAVGTTAAAVFADIESYCTARKTAGWNKIILGTLLPHNTYESQRESLNALIRAVSSPPWDYLADWGNDAIIGQSGQNANSTYYGADQIHPLNAGYQIMAAYGKAQLSAAGIG